MCRASNHISKYVALFRSRHALPQTQIATSQYIPAIVPIQIKFSISLLTRIIACLAKYRFYSRINISINSLIGCPDPRYVSSTSGNPDGILCLCILACLVLVRSHGKNNDSQIFQAGRLAPFIDRWKKLRANKNILAIRGCRILENHRFERKNVSALSGQMLVKYIYSYIF